MFEKLIGNEPVKSYISKLLAAGRFPNSSIFAGPEGIGKKAFALEAARAFVCRGGHGACGACGACSRVGKFNIPNPGKKEDFDEVFFSEHPDVGLVVPYNRNVRVGAIRRLETEANFRPYEARARVFIVDDADKMADSPANALLKTLEEPASTSHIILVTSRPDALLPTVRSRSQVLRFTAVAAADIRAHLLGTGRWTRDDAALVSRVCAGSVARALSMDIERFRAERSAMLDVLESAATPSLDRLLQASEGLNDARNKDDFESNLSILEGLMRDVWLLKIGGGESSLTNCDIAEQLTALARTHSTSAVASWLAELGTLRSNLSVNINRKVASDALFVSMAA